MGGTGQGKDIPGKGYFAKLDGDLMEPCVARV